MSRSATSLLHVGGLIQKTTVAVEMVINHPCRRINGWFPVAVFAPSLT